jgi:PKD repeat protein
VVPQPRWLRALALTAVTTVITAAAIAMPVAAQADTAPLRSSTPSTVSSDALPTVQVDGVVWTQVIVGNTVFAGGDFTTAQPAGAAPGVGTVSRTDLLAYDLTTGELITSFAPTFDAQVRTLAASPDGSTIYAGGNFATVNGVAKSRIVALDAKTGAIRTSFAAKTNSGVYTIAATSSTVYLGGSFTSADGVARTRAAAVDATTGALTTWAPVIPDNLVRGLAVSPDGSKVLIGGAFTSLNGSTSPGQGLGAVDAVSGANIAWNGLVYNHGTKASITSVTSDGTNVYVTGYVFGSTTDGNLEGMVSYRWADGSLNWIEDCHGDTYSAARLGDAVYIASHAHYCGNVPDGFNQSNSNSSSAIHQRGLAFSAAATGTLLKNTYGSSSTYVNFGGNPSPTLLAWYPTLTAGTYTGQEQAAWSVAAGNGYVVFGGEFPEVNGVRQTGLVRFAVPTIAPNLDGPQVSGTAWTPTAVSSSTGTVRLSWPANYDRDNASLTYSVYRDGGSTPVSTITATSHGWWDRPQLGVTDTGLTPGATVTYTVKARDPFGNSATSAAATTTVSATGVASADSAYTSVVTADGAVDLWRLDEPVGSATATDTAGYNDLGVGSGVTFGASGAFAGSTDTAATFAGSSTGFAATKVAAAAPNSFTVEAWFKTTSKLGGKIAGYGSANSGNSSTYDRHVYMDKNGKVYFGVNPGAQTTVSSSAAYNDGKWHQVAATLGSSGMALYVDGALVGSRTDATQGQAMNGYWRIGGDSSWSGAADFTGSIDDVAVYAAPLTAAKVLGHYQVAMGAAATTTPTAVIGTTAVSASTVAVDGAASTDSGGKIVGYAWNFGDGSSATGATAQHTYVAGGTYTVTLTVTDSSGVKATATKDVSAAVQNQAPTASFSTVTSGLIVAFDATASKDLDGSVASYAWSFGDGTTGTGSAPTHTFGSAGTYAVGLTVTDDRGATGTLRQQITVAKVNTPPTATFTKTVSGLTVSVDASGATDPDGSIAAYAWSFGDGSTATGATAKHAFAVAGSYSITLTTTDDQGATASSSATVTVSAPVAKVLGTDAFERTVQSGLGSADSGGPWTTAGAAADFSVSAGTAVISTTAGATRSAYLGDVSVDSSDVAATFTVSAVPTGGGMYGAVVGRRVGSTDYNARISVSATGTVGVQLLRDTTALASKTISGLTYTPGMRLRLRLQVSGANPATLQARIWQVGSAEPGTWQATATDTTSALQASGSIGLRVLEGSGVTSGAAQTTIDDFAASTIGTAAANVPPVGAITATTKDLAVTVDGSGSSDSDGKVTSYGWDFGDGGTATGSSATHTYSSAGAYTVTLTVTDDGGATSTATKQVTVTAPAVTRLGSDAFGRTVAAGLGTADTGGAWTIGGGTTYASVNGGTAVLSAPKGATVSAYLGSVSSSSTNVTTSIIVPALPVGGSSFAGVVGRRIGSDDYNARIVVAADGSVQLQLLHAGTALKSVALGGITASAGSAVHLRLVTSGAGTTTLQARAWIDGTVEPATWQATATDITVALQGAGSVGIRAYLGSAVSNGPLGVRFDDFAADPA